MEEKQFILYANQGEKFTVRPKKETMTVELAQIRNRQFYAGLKGEHATGWVYLPVSHSEISECPYCGEKDKVDWGPPQAIGGGEVYREHTCNTCGRTFQEIFIFAYAEGRV